MAWEYGALMMLGMFLVAGIAVYIWLDRKMHSRSKH